MARPIATPLGPQARRWSLAAAGFSALALLRLVPPWLAASLIVLGLFATWSGRRRPLPGWVLVPLTLATAGLVFMAFDFRFGRDTGSALLLAMLALKTGETSRLRDGRALVGFALFATFAAFLQDQGPLTLLLALPAVAVTLAASRQLAAAELGRLAPAPVWPPLRQTALAMLLGLPLALTAFWLFPRLGSPMWGVPENALARTGISGEMSPGDWLDLMVDDSVAFRVVFDGEPPARSELYWRGPVLWSFDGRTWSRPAWAATLPEPVVEAGERRIGYELTMEPTERHFLFALDLPLSAPAQGRLDGDLSPFSQRPVNHLVRYRLEAAPEGRLQRELPPRLREAALALPDGFNPRIREEMAEWRATGLDDEAVIARSLEWFERDFGYSLAAPPLGRHSVDEFMYQTRLGFCEHFSSSFVFMMRAAGIPARAVTGYVGGYRNPLGEHWRIQQSDAHAWSEVWLEGRGWVRVDPTAVVAPNQIFQRYGSPGYGGALGNLRRNDGPLQGLANISDVIRRNWNEIVLGFNAERQRDLLRQVGLDDAREWQIGVVFAVVASLAATVTVLLMLREREPERDPLLRAYRRFLARLARAGVAKHPDEPLLRFAERAAIALPDAAAQVHSLSARLAEARYAAQVPEPASRAALVRDLDAFRVPRGGAGPHRA